MYAYFALSAVSLLPLSPGDDLWIGDVAQSRTNYVQYVTAMRHRRYRQLFFGERQWLCHAVSADVSLKWAIFSVPSDILIA